MPETWQDLVNRAEEKKAELDTIVSRGADASDADIARGHTLATEIEQIQVRVTSARELQRKAQDAGSWLNTPRTRLPNEAARGIGASGAQYLGSYNAGSAQIDTEKRSVLFTEDGVPLMNERQMNAIRNPAYVAAWKRMLKVGYGRLSADETRALTEGATDGGGALVPEEYIARIIEREPTPTRIGDMVESIPVSRDSVVVPKVDYSASDNDLYPNGIRVTNSGEQPPTAASIQAAFPTGTDGTNQVGYRRIDVHTHMMSMPISRDLLEDAAFPVADWVIKQFRMVYRLFKDNKILNGSGQGEPEGVLVNPGGSGQPIVVPMGDPITGDGVLDVSLLVPEQYEDGLTYVMNKTSTYRTLKHLKTGDGFYLFAQGVNDMGLAMGRPQNINGTPYVWSGFAPNVGSNNYPIICGQWNGYWWLDRVELTIEILREIQAPLNQVLVLARFRCGGGLMSEWGFRIGQQAAA